MRVSLAALPQKIRRGGHGETHSVIQREYYRVFNSKLCKSGLAITNRAETIPTLQAKTGRYAHSLDLHKAYSLILHDVYPLDLHQVYRLTGFGLVFRHFSWAQKPIRAP